MSRKKGSIPPNKGKVLITPDQMQWLIDNFANEENFILADTLGISESTMHRYARMHGLKKSKAYMRRCQKEATDAAHYFNRISGRYEALSERMKNGGMSPKFIACRITSENHLWKRCPEKMRAGKVKGGQTLHQTWEEERRRVRLGLPQKTRLKVPKAADKKEMLAINNKRWYLRKHGYRIEGNIAYWNENTERALLMESHDTVFRYRMEESYSENLAIPV